MHTEACGGHGQPKPWQRHGRRGAAVTIIVIQILRLESGTVAWDDPLDSAMVLAVALLGIEMVCGAARLAARRFMQMLPKCVEFTRPNGRPRFAFGW
ncbi:hypothetical protein [Streptomyces uncialis]|uniref:hypothetical protein n=1 Tax=Streptomyces uncialis TaxID=1048205 RepID=UPI0037BA59BF